MAIDADELPREGNDSQNLVENFGLKYGPGAMDAIMSNLPYIAKITGAKPPDRINSSSTSLNNTNRSMPPGNFHVNTAKKDNIVKESINFNVPNVTEKTRYDLPKIKETYSEPVFFEDAIGNRYKTENDKLYILGWFNADAKFRLVSEKTGKEIPINGKKLQVYGWNIVSKINDSNKIIESKKIDNISDTMIKTAEIEDTKNTVNDVPKTVPPPSIVETKKEIVIDKVDETAKTENLKKKRLI